MYVDADTDAALVQAVRQSPRGDHRAFDSLVERHLAHVRANCEHLSGSRSDGEDLSQEVWVKAYFALDRLSDGARFRPWITRIKVNHCLDHIRKRRGRGEIELEAAVEAQAPEFQAPAPAETEWGERSRRARIRRVLESLPESLRVPVVLADMDGLSYQEVADALGLGLSATKMRIKRGRELFRTRFASEERRDADQAAQDPIARAARG